MLSSSDPPALQELEVTKRATGGLAAWLIHNIFFLEGTTLSGGSRCSHWNLSAYGVHRLVPKAPNAPLP